MKCLATIVGLLCLIGVSLGDDFVLTPNVAQEIPVERYRMPRIKFEVQNTEPNKGMSLFISSYASVTSRWLVSDEDYPVDAAHAKWILQPETNGIETYVEWTMAACEYTSLARLGDSFTLYIVWDTNYARPPDYPIEWHFIYHNGANVVQLEEKPGQVQSLEFSIPVCAPDSVLIIKNPESAMGQEIEMTIHPSDSILPFEMDLMHVAKYRGPHAFYCPEPEASWKRDDWFDMDPYSLVSDQGVVVSWTMTEFPNYRCPEVPVSISVTVGSSHPKSHGPTMSAGQIGGIAASAGAVIIVAWFVAVPIVSKLVLGPERSPLSEGDGEGDGEEGGEESRPALPAAPSVSRGEKVKAGFSRLIPVFIPSFRASGKGTVMAPPAYESLLGADDLAEKEVANATSV